MSNQKSKPPAGGRPVSDPWEQQNVVMSKVNSNDTLEVNTMYPISDKLPFEIWLCRYYPENTFIPSDYLICWVVSGQFDVTIENTPFHFCEGDIFLIQPEEGYRIGSDQDFLVCVLRMDFYFIVRCCDYQRPVFLESTENRLLSDNQKPELTQQLRDKMDFLTHLFFEEQQTGAARKTYHFYDFAYFFIENFRQNGNSPAEIPKKQRAYVITDYIESNYNAPITLNQLASDLGLTPQYLAAFIRKNMGTTFNTILYDIRFNHVLLDLVQTNEDITRILLNNGFPNTSGFNKMFKQRYHMTPTEYRKKEWQGNHAYDLFPQHIFTIENENLYTDFTEIRRRQKSQKHLANNIALELDSTKSTYLPNPWNLLVNLKAARRLLSFEYAGQLISIQSHIPYKYARIERLIHPHILCANDGDFPEDHSVNGSYNDSSMDSIIDQFHRLGLIPFIVLCPEKNDFFEMEHIREAVTHVLMHAIDRYGCSYVSQWKIEVDRPDFQTITEYVSYSARLFETIRQIGQTIGCGGPLFDLSHPMDELVEIVRLWNQSGCLPDFITLSVYPYTADHTVSLDPDMSIRRLARLSRALLRLQSQMTLGPANPIPLYVADFGFTKAHSSYINDTVFMASYTLYNFIGMKDHAQMMALPALSDISTGQPAASGDLLIGGRGILTLHSLFKPVFFAHRYLAGLGEKLLDCGRGRIITMNANGDIAMILYHYTHPEAYYCQEANHHLPLAHINDFYEDQGPIHFDICLTRLPARRYQVVRFRLSRTYGSIIDVWAASGGIHRVKNETLNYIRHTLAPRADFFELENMDGIRLNDDVAAQEILSIIINPMH